MIENDDTLISRHRPLVATPRVSAFERQAVRQALVIGVVALFIGLAVAALRPDPSLLVAAVPLNQVFAADD